MSSTDIIKSVSKKLKYYFQVKRLEDGFDLSSADCPRLDHPPVKSRPTLNYSGLHDRPLKHYFNNPDVKVALTQFKPPEVKKGREQQVKRAVQHNVRKYQFVEPPKKPKNKSPHLVGAYYAPPRKGSARRTHPGLTGFGNPPRRKKSNMRAGYPVLRSVPPRQISRGEAQRLINMATKLLVATETIDLGENGLAKPNRASSAKERNAGAPKPFESLPPVEQNKKGRVRSAQVRGSRYREPDSAYDSPIDSSSPTGDPNEQTGDLPIWLRRQMQKVELQDNESGPENQWVRPHSGYTNTVPKPPSEERPASARNSRKSSSSSVPKNGWGSEKSVSSSNSSEESNTSSKSSKSSSKEDAEVQTGGELLKKYEPMNQIAVGEKSNFRIHVHTGNKLGASTRAEIRLIIYGDKGRTQEMFLSDSRNHKIKFQKGQEDIFDIDAVNVGPIRKIAIGHDKKEISFGWYLDRVHLKDRGGGMQYFVQCDRWLSSREGDGRTFRDFNVTDSLTYNPGPDDEPEDFSPVKVDKPQIKYEKAESAQEGEDDRSIQGKTDTSSRTSLATLYSDRADAKKKQRRDSTSSSSSYTSTDSSTYSDGRRSPEQKTPQPLTPTTPTARKDDFFDQRPAGKDYSSLLDSLSTTTDQDNRNDFGSGNPGVYSKQPSKQGPTLKSVEPENDTPRVNTAKSSDTEEDYGRPKTSMGHREPAASQEGAAFIDGFKAGIEAAKKSEDVDSDSSSSSRSSTDYSGSQSVSIHQATKSGDISTVRKLIDKDPSLKSSTDEKGWWPIHTASAAGHVDIVKWLAVNNVNLDEMTPTGYTSMHLAGMNGQTNTMIVLVALGATIDSKSVEHQTPLHLAAMSGHLESVKFLVGNRANLKEADNLGRLPLDLAKEYQHQEVVQFLKACGKEAANPMSGLALLRKDSGPADKSKDQFPPLAGQRPRSPSESSSDSSSDSDNSSDSDSDEQNKKPSETVHDPELMEKKRLYAEQQQRQSKNVSFMDSIRAEYDNDF